MNATPSSGIGGMVVSDDGQHAIIQFETAAKPFAVAFPSKGLHGLAALALQMTEDVMRKSGEQVLQAFDAASWETSRAHDGHVLLSLILPSGARLTFRLHPIGATHMANSLLSQADAVDLPPDTTRN